ncbi:MAG TPA: amidohydrolase [Candidatus Binatia bacterium]|nr:amidohydrolase [Candidatus Binatia bacterium]
MPGLNQLALGLLLLTLLACSGTREADFERSLAAPAPADLVLRNGKIITVDRDFSIKQALAIRDGRFIAVGGERDVRVLIGRGTRVIDLAGRTVIPGLIDSHIHATVAGLNWDGELHWENLRSLNDGLKEIAAVAKVKAPGSWIVVGGGWVPTQFAERRFPTRAELDAIAPNHPVYIQYLRDGALLNRAALAALAITSASPDPSGGKFERNPNTGELTGWMQGAAWQHAYSKIPHLSLEQVRQSLLNCFHELNRLGITSVSDLHTAEITFAHRRLLAELARGGHLTVRLNFYIGLNEGTDEMEQVKLAVDEIKGFPRNDMFRFAGFGETLVRGDGDALASSKGLQISAEAREKFVRMARYFVENGYGFRLRSPGNDTARQWLDMLEEVNSVTPFSGQRIAFSHLEDATPETIARLKKLGVGITVQDRSVLTGERNVELWGVEKARNAPPLRTMFDSGIALGAGTDGFRAGNYSPMLSLWWLVTGKTVAGSSIRNKSQNLTREEALRLYTIGSAWFTLDEGRKGSIEVGKLADLVVLNADYLTVPEDQIRSLESLLTLVGGKVVYFAPPFTREERRPGKTGPT